MIDTISAALENIQWLSVVLATLTTFVVGAIWYHENVVGSRWMSAVPLKKKDIENANMFKTFSLSALAAFISAVALATFANVFAVDSAFDGALLGAIIGAFFVSASIASNYLFSQRKPELFDIDASYMTVTIADMVTVSGAC